jgi:hypothetical protein
MGWFVVAAWPAARPSRHAAIISIEFEPGSTQNPTGNTIVVKARNLAWQVVRDVDRWLVVSNVRKPLDGRVMQVRQSIPPSQLVKHCKVDVIQGTP